MNKVLFIACVLSMLSFQSFNKNNMKVADKTADKNHEWIQLFDGKTTKGWHSYGKENLGAAWKVENGTLHFSAGAKRRDPASGGDAVSDEEFANFHLQLEWKIAPKGNSGIFFYVQEEPKYQNTYFTGPEMQVLDNGSPTVPGHPDARLYTHRAGDLYDLLASKETVKPAGQWNKAEIIANKGKLEFYLNGQRTLSTTMWNDTWWKMIAISKFKDMPGFGKFKKGKIALQDHGDDVWYRNIRIRKL